ncbi:RNase III domain-containing protein [Histoplasma capsulatum G186AR]|nr:RNase III domain-containing protein [Histoplasma capsulatum]QSS76134.1 RNase III domain-containing protein [Histoplasma capsulatum G186AR]
MRFSLPPMASKIPGQAFTAISRPGRWRASSAVLSISSRSTPSYIRRHALSSAAGPEGSETPTIARWKVTPPAMKAPVRLRGSPDVPEFPVNSDPNILDQFYLRMLGPGGDKMLTEEVKWQTVTHKSFDQGRRGFNERLSYLGKQIVQLQASLSLLESSSNASPEKLEDPYGRTAFEHPSLQGLDILTEDNKNMRVNRTKLAELAQQYKLQEVLRWVPRYRNDLAASGLEVVLTQAIYAVVGAVALEKGGAVANQVARDSILKPLGFDVGMPRETL